MGERHGVRRTSVDDEFGTGDRGGCGLARHVDRYGLVGIAMDDEGRHVKRAHIGAEISLAEGCHAGDRRLRRGEHREVAGPLDQVGRDRRRAHPDPEEGLGEGRHEVRTVVLQPGDHAVEHRCVNALWVVGGLEHVRRHRRDEHRSGHPGAAVTAHVTGDLAAAHREPDQCHVLQIEGVEHRLQVVGEGVVIVTAPGLIRTAKAAAVVGDGAQARLGERQLLELPHVRIQRPAVD